MTRVSNDGAAEKPRFSRMLSWSLVTLHSLVMLTALWTRISTGSVDWMVPVVMDLPVVIPFYFVRLPARGDWAGGDWVTFAYLGLVGTLWQFYWPRALARVFSWPERPPKL